MATGARPIVPAIAAAANTGAITLMVLMIIPLLGWIAEFG
jgi:hypothetical protein